MWWCGLLCYRRALSPFAHNTLQMRDCVCRITDLAFGDAHLSQLVRCSSPLTCAEGDLIMIMSTMLEVVVIEDGDDPGERHVSAACAYACDLCAGNCGARWPSCRPRRAGCPAGGVAGHDMQITRSRGRSSRC